MNKKEELKKLIEESKEDSSFFSLNMSKQHLLFGLIFSPLYVLFIISDWLFGLFEYGESSLPPEIFRPLSLLIGIGLIFYSWYGYNQKKREEKEIKNKIDKIIDELKE